MVNLSKINYDFVAEENKGICQKEWIKISGIYYLYKENKTRSNYINCESFGEYVYNIIGKEVGVNVVDIEVVCGKNSEDNVYGCIVRSFIDKNVDEIISLSDVVRYYQENNYLRNERVHVVFDSCFHIASAVCDYATENNKRCDENALLLDLQKMCILDFFTGQVDRHESNIEFIISKGDNELKLSPVFDNGYCFGFGLDPTTALLDYQGDLYDNYQQKKFLRSRNDSVEKQYIESMIQCSEENIEIKNLIRKLYNVDIKKVFNEFTDEELEAMPVAYELSATRQFDERKKRIKKVCQELKKNEFFDYVSKPIKLIKTRKTLKGKDVNQNESQFERGL